MQTRKLGTEGLEVACIGLGCMGMNWSYGVPAEEDVAIKVIHRAVDLGVNFFDTAEVYGPFKNEVLLGKALKGRRDNIVVATKFGFNIEDGKSTGTNSRPEHLKAVADASLKRLGIDVIDLFYQHRVDKKVPIEETVGAMGELVTAGKVRFLGLSEAGPETIRRAHREHKISALQSEYSLWERGIEEKILPTLRELKIGFVPFCPIGRGFLTGEIKSFEDIPQTDYRRKDPRYQGENFKKNLQLVEKVKSIGKAYEATPAQVAIAWILAKGKDIAPIPGTKRISYLEENVRAADVKLSDNDIDELNSLYERVSGPRYEEQMMSMVER
jgi:aryl-alcohol dehydrogenase-like predicted oxidoreductase